MKTIRLSLMTGMFLYFSASCIAFFVAAIYVLHGMTSTNTLRSLLLLITELGMAGTFGLAACATMIGWRTRNRWGTAGSLLSICVPLPVLYWGVGMFLRYLLACLWPSWLFGVLGLALFLKAGTPHSLTYDIRKTLGLAGAGPNLGEGEADDPGPDGRPKQR